MKRLSSLLPALLIPCLGHTWGTLIAPKALPEKKISNLEWMCEYFGSAALKAEVRPRLGPHAMHQFVVQQAFKLLDKDPAYADGVSGLPTAQEVNTWDGIVHGDVGPVQRPGTTQAGMPEVLGPATTSELGGPSADAELLTDQATLNTEYYGAAHYWNPWLQSGSAPVVAGYYYQALNHRILEAGSKNDKAHYAAYLAHYMADVSSAKHADCIVLTEQDVIQLEKIAATWCGEISSDFDGWLKSKQIKDAIAIIQARAKTVGGDRADRWWDRVNGQVRNTPLRRGSSTMVNLYTPSLESSVGVYLWEMNHRPAIKGRMAFFNYFDPLYYNGPIWQQRGWQNPEFNLCVAMSNHLMWETNLAQFRDTALPTVAAGTALLDKPNDTYFSDVRPAAEFWGIDDRKAELARGDYMQALVKSCSTLVHGKDFDDNQDFDQAFLPYLQNSIRHVYLALRSSISALRVSARYVAVKPEDGEWQIKLTITNVADEPVNLRAFRILTEKDGKVVAPAGWDFEPINETLAKGAVKKLRIKLLNVPKPTGDPVFYAEVHGQYDKTPDSGARRTKAVKDDGLELVRNPDSAGDVSDTKGPLDLAICFDVTGSMQSSIDSMRSKAIEIVKALNVQSSDMRLCLCAFRDKAADGDGKAFELHPFSKDISSYIGVMGTWVADGGGDTPEDQLEAIRRVLELWKKEPSGDRKPTKIVVVITDAPAHAPDSFGNTFDSIAKLALEVDPAHIYPVVVGTDTEAANHAKTLADGSGGKVTASADYASAADKLLEVVKQAVAEHPAPAQGMSREAKMNLLLFGGGGVFLLGIVSFFVGSILRRKHRSIPSS